MKSFYSQAFRRLCTALAILSLQAVAPVRGADCTPPPAGLVGWWAAEGNTLDNFSGLSGLNVNANFGPGTVGQAFDFNGNNAYVQVPSRAELEFTGPFTVEAWVNFDSAGHNNTIVTKGDVVNGVADWTFFVSDSSRLRPHAMVNGFWAWFDCNTPLTTGTWYHAVMVFDGTHLQGYLNGVLDGSGNISGAVQATDGSLRIGAYRPDEVANRFDGRIDELSLYNRALSPSEILALYNAGSAGKCSPSTAAVPVITGFSPSSGAIGTAVTITGANFSPVPASNTVYFGAVRATVTQASATSLTVLVPAGATYAPISETVSGLVAYSGAPFQPTFAGNGSSLSASSFAPRMDLAGGDGPHQTAIGDLDGDGQPDVAVCNIYGRSFSLFRNLGAGSFAPRVDVTIPVPAATDPVYGLTAADVDGDGKLDLLVCGRLANQVLVYRNIATPGALSAGSFAAPLVLATGTDPRYAHVADIDGDGRAEIVTANVGNSVSIFRNIGTPGNLSFAPRVDLASGSGSHYPAIRDLDGDGKPDIAVVNAFDSTLSVFRNVAAPGVVNSGSFAPRFDLPLPDYPTAIVVGDLDGDGKPELLAGGNSRTISVYRNLSSPGALSAGSFAARVDFATAGWVFNIALGDLNGDAKPDISVVSQLSDALSLFQNLSTPGSFNSGSLGSRVDLAAKWNAVGVSVGDLDADGRPDVVFCSAYEDTVSIYRNIAPITPPGPYLIDVDFVGTDGPSGKVGFAAIGSTTNDYWNWYTRNDGMGGWRTFGSLSNLQLVDGTVTQVGMTIANAPGAWDSGSTDLMYDGYIYPFGGNATITVTNLPAGQYDLYAYSTDGNYEVNVGGTSYGVRTTRDAPLSNPPVWTEGRQYARFTNVAVNAGQSLVLTVRPGLDGYAIIAGMQLTVSGTTNVPPPPPTNCVSAPSGMVSWWRAEGNALDSAGANHGALLPAAGFASGFIGQTFSFNGTSNSYIEVPDAPALRLTNELTIEFWVKRNRLQMPSLPYADYIIEKGGDWTGGVQNYGAALHNSGFNYCLHFTFAGGWRGAGSIADTQTWHHCAIVARKGDVDPTFYIDGVAQPVIYRQGAEVINLPSSTRPVHIGAQVDPVTGWKYFSDTLIDDLSLYNRALSVGEIQAIYNAGSAGKCPPSPAGRFLIDVDFVGTDGPSGKVGFAAIGSTTNDYWNWYTRNDGMGGWRTFGSLTNLQLVDGTVTQVGMTIANAPGAWGSGSSDPMYDGYIYPFSGNATITATNLSSGLYDVYAYSTDGNYEVNVGGTSYGIRTTRDAPLSNPPVWTEGRQYARFTNVVVNAGQSLVLTVRPGLDGYAIIAGMQLTVSGTTDVPPPVCSTAPSNMVGWWPGENDAVDSASGNPSVIEGGVAFGPGKVGQAFVLNGTADVKVPANPTINVGLGGGLSIEGWINPSLVNLERPIVEWNSGTSFGAHFWISVVPASGTGPGCLYANLVDTFGSSHIISSAPGLIQSNVFQHVAVTYDKASGVARLFLNGTIVAQQNLGSFSARTSYDMYLGRRVAGGAQSLRWLGSLDEISLYSRALSGAEIQGIYNAGAAGKCSLPPTIAVQPASQTVVAGDTATFTVAPGGTPPFAYQWSFNGTNIIGETSALLVLTSVQLNQAGNYAVTVSNLVGSATSSNALLTVIAPGSCVPAHSDLVGWWRGENDAVDSAAGNPSVIQGGVAFGPGKVGQAFVLNGTDASVRVPANPTINVGLGGGFSIEGWIKPSLVNLERPIVEWNSGSFFGAHFWISVIPVSGAGPGCLYANLVDTRGSSHPISSAPGLIQSNLWQHVAVTYDKVSGVARLFLNGTIVAQQTLGSFTPQTGYDMYLGRRVAGGAQATRWLGSLDEISLYSRALSTVEIQTIYNARGAGKCLPPHPPVPVITGFSPSSATNGTPVTITGTNFSPVASSNVVYFGAVRAIVTAAGPNSLTVLAPAGAIYAPITVTVGGLVAYSQSLFQPTFAGSGANLSTASFAPRLDLAGADGTHLTAIADLDGDGKPDIAVVNIYGRSLSLFRNIGSGGIGAGTFAARIDIPVSAPAGPDPLYGIAAADVDRDGKLDLLICSRYDNQVRVYRNISTVGVLTAASFAAPVALTVGGDPRYVRVADLDGDGRPEIVTANVAGNSVSVLRNLGAAGSLTAGSFAPKVDFPAGAGTHDVAIGDLDGDGKPDLATVNANEATVAVLRNLATPGVINSSSFAPRFTLAAPSHPIAIAIGDVDGDGKLDLISGSYLGSLMAVYRNISTPGGLNAGSFAARVNFTTAGRSHTIGLGDLNGDARPDIALVTELSDAMSVFQNLSTPGSFDNASLGARIDLGTLWNAWGVSVGDLDADGRPDLVFCNAYDDTVSIYRNMAPLAPVSPSIVTQPADQLVTEGDPATFTVVAEGTAPLNYQWMFEGTDIIGETNASLVLAEVQTTDAGNYAVLVSNAGGSILSSNAVLVVNRRPIANAGATPLLVISASNTNATVVLDGSLSSDPDGDPLQYFWFETGASDPFATGVVAVVVLPLGSNSITLRVHDGLASDDDVIAVEILTPSQAVERMIATVQDDVSRAQSLAAILTAALHSIDRSNPTAAINQLQAFQNQVQAQLAPLDQALADLLIQAAQDVIDSLEAGGAEGEPKGQIKNFKRHANGKAWMEFSGKAGRTYIIEASSNLRDWVKIGVAKHRGNGNFDYEDASAANEPHRYYRVVIP